MHVVKSLGGLLCVDTFMTLKLKTTHLLAMDIAINVIRYRQLDELKRFLF